MTTSGVGSTMRSTTGVGCTGVGGTTSIGGNLMPSTPRLAAANTGRGMKVGSTGTVCTILLGPEVISAVVLPTIGPQQETGSAKLLALTPARV